MATQIAAEKKPPGLKKIPFIDGGVWLAGNLPEFTHHRLELLQRMAGMGDVIALHFGPFPAILFNKPEYIQSILVEHAYDFDKGLAIHNVFRPVIGDGIFSSEGDLHRHQRKLIAPSFQPRQIANYADIMVHYGEQIQQGWADGSVVDINQRMTDLTEGATQYH
ncbi:MAG TPA: cytochrome P450 [Ktedonobacteraceae bacterium]